MSESDSSAQPTVTESEPVVVYTAIGVVAAAALSLFGIIVDPGTVTSVILAVVAFAAPLVAAFKARQKVTPTEFPKFN